MPVYAHCPHCGLDFESGAITGYSENVTILTQETCPRCGGLAKTMEGTFHLNGPEPPTILAAPAWSRALVHRMTPAQARRIHTAVQWAQSQLDTPNVDEERLRSKIDNLVEREAPWLSRFINVMLGEKTERLVQLLGFILVVLTFFGFTPDHAQSEKAPSEITEDQLRELFDDYLERGTGSDTRSRPAPTQEAPSPEPPPTIDA